MRLPWPHITVALTLAAMCGCSGNMGLYVPIDTASTQPTDNPTAAAKAPAARTPTASIDEPITESADFAEPTHPVSAPAASDTGSNPRFASDPAIDEPLRKKFTNGLNLWGELPGQNDDAPRDATLNIRQVSYTREGADFDATITPDGKHLFYASTRHRKTADIYMKSVDGQTVTQFTSDPANDVMPAVSPDGSMVAFCSDRSGNWDIYVKRIEGGKTIQITQDPAHEVHPSWSPDGTELIFSALGRQSGKWEMVVVDVDFNAKRRFIGFGLFPEFSPDGRKIVYQRARFRGTRTFSVWTMDYADGEGRHPTEIAGATNAAVINPTSSPDGRRVAFATVLNPTSDDPTARPESANLWIINVDGTGRVKLTNDTYANLQPTWSPDGTIFFVSNRSGYDNIWSVRPVEGMLTARSRELSPTPSGTAVEVPTDP